MAYAYNNKCLNALYEERKFFIVTKEVDYSSCYIRVILLEYSKKNQK